MKGSILRWKYWVMKIELQGGGIWQDVTESKKEGTSQVAVAVKQKDDIEFIEQGRLYSLIPNKGGIR